MTLPLLDSIEAKMLTLQSELRRVGTHRMPINEAWGRVLAQDLIAFRDSPPMDLSAMDGYALRRADLSREPLPVSETSPAGSPPRSCPQGAAIRIFTGAPVPEGADCIVPREQCDELGDRVRVRVPNEEIRLGQHIRRRGENAPRGYRCLSAGTVIDGPRAATWTSFSETAISEIFEPVRVAVLNTGDELTDVGEPICDWQIRDSNGPLLESMMHPIRWIHARREKVRDDAATVCANLRSALEGADAVLLTGGVSMGDTDHVPEAVAACGGRIVFHRIPIRPGKPLLGAVGPVGQLILGLPGNPVSVAVTFRRYAWPLLRYLAGIEPSTEPTRWVNLECDDRKTLDLLWFRLAMLDARGQVSLVPNQGSGDVAALGQSHGFVEIPPGAPTRGTVAFYDWRCPS